MVQASKPFVFLDLRLPPKHVEVNVHPTKREVGMLNQVGVRVREAESWMCDCCCWQLCRTCRSWTCQPDEPTCLTLA
jgi:hypothetical protein